MTTFNLNMNTNPVEYDARFPFKVKDPMSALSHFIGFLGAIILTPILMIHVSEKGAELSTLISLTVFMMSMILLYGASTSYHSFNISPIANKVLKRIDHMSIFVLIAGSYTPLCVTAISGHKGMVLLIMIWVIAFAGICFKYFWVTCPKWVSSVIYIAMGWVCIVALPELISGLTLNGFLWLLGGGLFYTIGGVIYSLKLKIIPENNIGFGNHELFHLFVLAGSLCHYIVMFCYL